MRHAWCGSVPMPAVYMAMLCEGLYSAPRNRVLHTGVCRSTPSTMTARLAASKGMWVMLASTRAASLKRDASNTNEAVAMASPSARDAILVAGFRLVVVLLVVRAGLGAGFGILPGVTTAPDRVDTILLSTSDLSLVSVWVCCSIYVLNKWLDDWVGGG